ncbi:MAG: precorrin-6y C5,15-methyltransferase (decarboxylating) subunit CbiE [Bacillota bacterium]
MQKIKVIGVGPGSPSYITREALEAIAKAGLLIGGKRHLESFALNGQDTFVLSNNLEEVTQVIKSRFAEGVAVLATGDPGMYGVLNYLVGKFNPDKIEVIPGISSIQLAFARICLPWHDAVTLSAHGRPADSIKAIVENSQKAAVLTGPDNSPEKIYDMINTVNSGKIIYLCFDLSLPSEEIVKLNTGDVYPKELKGRYNCVMVITNE